MIKSNQTDILIQSVKSIIYTYGSIEECAKDFNLDVHSVNKFLNTSSLKDDCLITASKIWGYRLHRYI